MGNPVELTVDAPATIIEQIVADWTGSIVIFRLKPGVFGALGADGDIVEALTGVDRPRWTVKTEDGQTFRAYPILGAELESTVISTLLESELETVVIETVKRKGP